MELLYLYPELIIVVLIISLTLLDVTTFAQNKSWHSVVGILFLLWAMVYCRDLISLGRETLLEQWFVSPVGNWLKILLIGITSLVFLAMPAWMADSHDRRGSPYILILISLLGGMVMVSAINWVLFFVGLELLSLPLYALSGMRTGDTYSLEAGLKYFIFGAVASSVTLLGIVLLYGASGSFSVYAIPKVGMGILYLAGWVIVAGGLFFKIGLLPFGFWVPDVYEGSPTLVTGFMAAIVKVSVVGFFLVFVREIPGFPPLRAIPPSVFIFFIVITLTIGTLLALVQDNFKRLLAFSSVTHVGYIFIGILAGNFGGWRAIVFYLVPYTAGVIMLFTISACLEVENEDDVPGAASSLERWRGLRTRHPVLAFLAALALLSLAGVPPFGGFFGKLLVWQAALLGGYLKLTLFSALIALISVYYYLNIIVLMYFKKPDPEQRITVIPGIGQFVALAIAGYLIVATGINFSGWVSEISRLF